MKLFVVCLLGLVALSLANPAPAPSSRVQRCIYVNGRCQSECEEGTHSYTNGCGKTTPEPTCDVPNPVQEEHNTCDYSACYCDAPTVRDTKSNKCVKLEDCPKK